MSLPKTPISPISEKDGLVCEMSCNILKLKLMPLIIPTNINKV